MSTLDRLHAAFAEHDKEVLSAGEEKGAALSRMRVSHPHSVLAPHRCPIGARAHGYVDFEINASGRRYQLGVPECQGWTMRHYDGYDVIARQWSRWLGMVVLKIGPRDCLTSDLRRIAEHRYGPLGGMHRDNLELLPEPLHDWGRVKFYSLKDCEPFIRQFRRYSLRCLACELPFSAWRERRRKHVLHADYARTFIHRFDPDIITPTREWVAHYLFYERPGGHVAYGAPDYTWCCSGRCSQRLFRLLRNEVTLLDAARTQLKELAKQLRRSA